ncbi:MAG: OsmC family protein [Candidatus Poseidoniaceae archaeon]|nr:OsmC family protein [Candidatus Poseidoniaceae archaeon]MDG1556436.1 OsmC family protein [Candidatus Poseidoniaceae archaeon]MDG1557968.1 OsmC family protein [Candidatus Poseidoniaceae archaeon]
MYGRVDWTGGDTVACTNERGDRLDLNWEDGPTPMEVVMQMIGACSTADLVLGLKERSFSEVWVEMEGTRAESVPKVFTDIHMVYHVRGDVPLKLVERIVAKSHEKYCTVSQMFVDVNMTHACEVHN